MVAFLAVFGRFIFTVSSYPVDLISTAGSMPWEWSSLVAALALQYSQSLHLHWSHYTHVQLDEKLNQWILISIASLTDRLKTNPSSEEKDL